MRVLHRQVTEPQPLGPADPSASPRPSAENTCARAACRALCFQRTFRYRRRRGEMRSSAVRSPCDSAHNLLMWPTDLPRAIAWATSVRLFDYSRTAGQGKRDSTKKMVTGLRQLWRFFKERHLTGGVRCHGGPSAESQQVSLCFLRTSPGRAWSAGQPLPALRNPCDSPSGPGVLHGRVAWTGGLGLHPAHACRYTSFYHTTEGHGPATRAADPIASGSYRPGARIWLFWVRTSPVLRFQVTSRPRQLTGLPVLASIASK